MKKLIARLVLLAMTAMLFACDTEPETPVEPENPGDNTENPDNNPDVPEETPGKPEDENPGEVQGGNNQGNTSSGNAFVDFILSIIEAIKKFFMNLFS